MVDRPGADSHPGVATLELSLVHRAIVAVDIESSTTRPDSVKALLRKAMYEIVEEALHACGIVEEHLDPLGDRGDGVLVLIRPVDHAPKTLLLNTFIPTVNDLLAEYESRCPEPLRLRAAVHAGEVNYDRRGCFGEAIDLTFRLLNAPEVKGALRDIPARLVLVVSDHFYRTIIRHGHGLDGEKFAPLVNIDLAGHRHIGWIRDATAAS